MAAIDIARTLLPDIPNLIRVCKAIAMLDAILCEEWMYRYYSFNSRWSQDDPTELMASMRNGSGDHYHIWFGAPGVAMAGFAHESQLSPAGNNNKIYPGILDSVPTDFANFLNEPAFTLDTETTFCFWRGKSDSMWHTGNVKYPDDARADPDGAEEMLGILDGEPSTYVNFASDYFEVDIDEEDVAHIYELKPLDSDLLQRLECQRTLAELSEDIAEIGYP